VEGLSEDKHLTHEGKNMRIFITGATGFIGTHLGELLAKTESEMFCLVRKRSPAVEHLRALGAKLVPGDVTDKASVIQGMKGCDWVFHLAGLYSFWEPRKERFKDVNITGTRNVMESVLDTGVSKVVHVSTVGVYGKPEDIPFTEKSEVGPVRFCEYCRTKYEGDLIVWELHEKQGLPVVVVYPSAVVGRGDAKATGQYIVNLIRRRLPATVFNTSIMTFVHVRDVAEVIVRAAEKQNNIGEKYFVGKEEMPFQQLNQMVSQISGVPLPKLRLPNSLTMAGSVLLTGLASLIKRPPPWGMSLDQMRVMLHGFRVDGSKAKRELCISYTPIRAALEEAIASYRQQVPHRLDRQESL
jgi:dihydroflavonol-4-reductase